MTAGNLVSYSAQIAILVLACGAFPRALRLRSPGLQYVFWRALLALCLLLPMIEPWQHHEMVFVPASPAFASSAVRGAPPSSSGIPAPFGNSVTIAGMVILCGMLARLAWLSAGVVRLQRLRQRATDASSDFADLQQTIAPSATILWSDEVRQPVTFGILRPIVLLPAALAAADSDARRAVVAHELHHVARHDWAWVVGEEAVRSVFWFHPAMWWLISRVQLARETVVDELSILTTNARRAYLDALLAFADDAGLASTPAFSARRHLFHRVMLLSKEGTMSSSRIALAACVLAAALGAGSWGVVRAFPLASIDVANIAPQPAPSRDAAIQQAVLFWNKALNGTSLPSGERLDLLRQGIEQTDRVLSSDPSDRDALVWKSVMLRLSATLTDHVEASAFMLHQANELRDKAIALEKQLSSPQQTRTTPGQLPPPPPPPRPREIPPPPPPPPPPGDMPESFKNTIDRLHPIRLGETIPPPVKIKDVRPVYPKDAMDAKIQGTVEIEAIVDGSGRVADSRVISGVPELNDAALKAVSDWEFRPTLLNGQPTPILITCTITFTLR